MPERRHLLMLGLAALAGCGTTPSPAPSPGAWEALQVRPGERALTVDTAASRLSAYVFRGGAAARLGHNHVLRATDFEVLATLGDAGLASARLQLQIRLDSLQVDDPGQRAELGGAFAKPLDVEAIAGTRANMLGERGLQASAYPLLRVRSLKLVGEAPWLAALVEIELHGRQRQQWLALRVAEKDQRLAISGAIVLRQTEFGLQPFSLLGGLLAVADEIVVEFEIVLIKATSELLTR